MKSAFGTRLFKLFLLFSAIPAVVLALVGYYLAVETGSIPAGRDDLDATDIVGFYNDYLFTRIDKHLDKYLNDQTLSPGFVDFLFEVSDGQTEILESHPLVSLKAMQTIIRAGANRVSGFAEIDGSIIQFARIEPAADKMIYAGLIHGQEYSELMEAVQADRASRTSTRELWSRYLLFLATVFALVAAAIVAVAYYFSNRISKNLATPLAELSAASREIAAGNFDQEVRVPASGEIETLVNSFNRMARQLEQAASRLAQSERVAAWRNVARRFAHELKNPLQPITISLYRIEKLLQGSSKYDEAIQPLRAASEELKHLTSLADRFSHLAKLPPPALERVNLGELLVSIADLYDEQLAEYDFSLELPANAIHAQLDPTYFRETLHNLLQNSIDASAKGGRIILRLRERESHIDIAVQDFGEGMSAETVSSARLPYYTTKEKGSGLGLAIVEKIVIECGGQLSIDSKRERGTTVTISLPREG